MSLPASTLDELFQTIAPWYETDIPQNRITQMDASGRKWFLDSVSWGQTLKLEDLRKATNRYDLNRQYTDRWKETDAKAKKGISALKTEISQLYSFNKCFVQRYKTRLQYYKDDSCQKVGRTMFTVGQSMAPFITFKSILES